MKVSFLCGITAQVVDVDKIKEPCGGKCDGLSTGLLMLLPANGRRSVMWTGRGRSVCTARAYIA